MIIATDQYVIRSQNANQIYWEQGVYPDWTALSAYRHFPDGAPGTRPRHRRRTALPRQRRAVALY